MKFEFVIDRERKVAYLHIPESTLEEICHRYLGKYPRRKVAGGIARVFAEALEEIGRLAGFNLDELTPVILDDAGWKDLVEVTPG